jgi:hypothetical protein
MTTIDQLVAMSRRLAGAQVLFVGHGRSCGPGPGVLLVLPTGQDKWELPTDEVTTDSNLDAVVPFGGVLLARVDSQFEPAPSTQYDDHCWTSPEFAVGCAANHPSTTAVLQQFLAAQGDSQPGEDRMEDRTQFTAAQQKADAVARLFGDSAPGPLNGEGLIDYRVRLATPYQKHSKSFKDAKLSLITDPATLAALENQIFADARAALHDPATFRPGELRAVVVMDGANRPITKYIGDPNACWDQFNPPIRHVRRINVPGRP